MIYLESPVYCQSSFNTIETYICMTSMMMLEITMEVRVNIDLPLKGRAQAWLGHSTFLALLDTFGNFWKVLLLGIGKLYSFGLWAKFNKSKK